MSETVPEFALDRIRLRPVRPSDLPAVYVGLSDPLVIAHYGVSYSSIEATEAQMQWFEKIVAEQTGAWWAIADLKDDSMIGACGFNDWSQHHRRVELGYWLMPTYWRQGLLTDALPSVFRYAFEVMGVHRIHADVEPANEASCALLRKLGFHHDGTLRDVELKDGEFLSLHQYSLLRTDPVARMYLD
ncbi:GNAT family N-acetyltransferase [Pseudomonas sp. DOAB1069]|uniref:GNAT family N-acetyltransferase n=1 Tax=Pseudomonas folii TaxID=2762593 RepID=A0ABR7ATX8_9PSED|nr:GNAT family N-acetyltransferase [Pseudomonas folii]